MFLALRLDVGVSRRFWLLEGRNREPGGCDPIGIAGGLGWLLGELEPSQGKLHIALKQAAGSAKPRGAGSPEATWCCWGWGQLEIWSFVISELIKHYTARL